MCFIPLIESKNKDYGDLNLDIPLLRLYASVYFGVYFGCAFASCIREKRKLIKAGNRYIYIFLVILKINLSAFVTYLVQSRQGCISIFPTCNFVQRLSFRTILSLPSLPIPSPIPICPLLSFSHPIPFVPFHPYSHPPLLQASPPWLGKFWNLGVSRLLQLQIAFPKKHLF